MHRVVYTVDEKSGVPFPKEQISIIILLVILLRLAGTSRFTS
jgi:hypothetical protein